MKQRLKKLVFIILIFISKLITAQDLPLYNQFILNGMLLNPAVAGRYNDYVFKVTDRHQWLGLEGAPQTAALTAQIPIDDQNGTGFCFFSDKYGALSNNGLQIYYSHHLFFKKKQNKALSLGMSINGGQISLQRDKATFWDNDDPNLDNENTNRYYIDATVGALYTHRDFFIGLSAANFTKQMQTNNDEILKKYTTNIFLYSGTSFALNKRTDIEPSILIKGNEEKKVQIDANLRLFFDDRVWTGISLKTSKTALAMFGCYWRNLSFAYIFEIQSGGLYRYSYGTHELMLGLNLSAKRGAVPCPAYH